MDAELFQRMQDAALRFRSGESDYEEIDTPNGLARLVRDPEDPRGFRIEFVGDGASRSVALQTYPASASRPPGYPAPLPFLENCTATVDTGTQTVTWIDPEGPEEALERLVQESVDDGWAEVDLHPVVTGGGDRRQRVLEKDGVERTFLLTLHDGRGRLVMTEKQRPGS